MRKTEETRPEKSVFCKMIDRICQMHPEYEGYRDTKEALCQEFICVVSKMQGTDLEPYLAEMGCVPDEGCFKIAFKLPLVPYSGLMDP